PEGRVLALLVLLSLQDPAGIDPDSQLAAGRLPEARRAAEQFVAQQPSDPHAHLALGWVWQAWPAEGRYRALDEFRTAERLAPGEPAPLWGQVAVGYRLGSDEGEGIARRALLRLLELRPGDRLAWARFLELYHDDAIWRRFAATGPGDARRFFLWFWSKRDPNLITPQNERIAEHFRRLAVVRRRFQLLHPLSLYHRSATARRLATAALPGTLPQFVAAALGPDA